MHNRCPFGGLPHHQGSSSSEFVRNAHLGGLQLITEEVWLSTQILQAGQAGDADGNANRAVPPGTSMRVNDQHTDFPARDSFHLRAYIFCRPIWVFRE